MEEGERRKENSLSAENTDCPPLTQKGLSALYSDAGVISFLILASLR